jgi:hypothetical protein
MRSAEPWAKPWADGLALAALAAFAVAAVLTFRDYGLGWDDYTHSEYGDMLLALYGSGFSDRRALSFVNLYMYGGGFDMAAALADKVSPFTLFETRRLIGALVGLIGFALTWRIAQRVGGPLAGLLALLLLLSCPHYFGHVFINAKDAPFSVAILALLLGFVRAIDDYPNLSRLTVVIFGLGLGVAFGSRILAVVSAVPFAAAVIFAAFADARRRGARDALHRLARYGLLLAPAAAIGIIVMGLLWPWSILDPLNVFKAAEYFRHFFEKPWQELYAGRLIGVPDMPANYVPQLFALKLPEGLLVFATAGAVFTVSQLWRGARPPNSRANVLMIALAAILPIALAVITRPAGYNGIRHFLFAVPPIAILAGLSAARLIDTARAHSRPALIAATLLLAAAVIDPVIAMMRLHPFQYTFFNHIAGGVRGAHGNYMLDYWGLAFKQASEALRARLAATGEQPPPGRRWIVAVCGPQRPAEVALGPRFETTAEPQSADFAIMLGAFYCRDLKLPALAEISRQGVSYARVHDLRGRNVTDLLTQPPP